jgi:hypothetical protein
MRRGISVRAAVKVFSLFRAMLERWLRLVVWPVSVAGAGAGPGFWLPAVIARRGGCRVSWLPAVTDVAAVWLLPGQGQRGPGRTRGI